MFSRRSQSTVTPPQLETSHGAPVSILNSGLAFALMEEKDVVNLFKKLSDTHMQSMNHMMEWAKAQSSPLFSVIYGKVAEMTWMWSQILSEASNKYGNYIKILQEVFSEERAIEETHKAACFAQQQVSKAQKNLESLKKKSDTSKHSALQREFETATENYQMLSKKLLDQKTSVQKMKLTSIRQGLMGQAELYLSVSECCKKLFMTQQQLADLIPEDQSSLSNEETIKATECSMNECIFGLAEHLDLWPPESGGVTGSRTRKERYTESQSSPSMKRTEILRKDSESSLTPSSLQGSQESLNSTNVPPALPPPRSPMCNRRSKDLKDEDLEHANVNNNNSRSRCHSLSLHDRNCAKKGNSKEKIPQDTKPGTNGSDDVREWALKWRHSRRPGSVHFGVRYGLDSASNGDSQLARYNHYRSDPDLLQSFKDDVEAHYVIATSSQGHSKVGKERYVTFDTSTREEDPYSTPLDALASFSPRYVIHRQTPDSYPVLKKVRDPTPPRALLKKRFHSSVDSICSAVGQDPSEEGVYAVPFDVLLKQRRQPKESSPFSISSSKENNPPRTFCGNHVNVRRSSSMSQAYKDEVNPRRKWQVVHRRTAEWEGGVSPRLHRTQTDLPPKPNTEQKFVKEATPTHNNTTTSTSRKHEYCEIDLLPVCPIVPILTLPDTSVKSPNDLFEMEILQESPPRPVVNSNNTNNNNGNHHQVTTKPERVEVSKIKSSKAKLVAIRHKQ